MNFDPGRQVADAVLYEGYILYPYRASAQKNRLRWQFGVVAPQPCSEESGSDPWATQTECLLECEGDTILHVKLRFLQMQARTIEEAVDAEAQLFRPVDSLEIEGTTYVTWEEGIEREIDAALKLSTLFNNEETLSFRLEGENSNEPLSNSEGKFVARVERQSWPISGRLVVAAQRLDSQTPVAKLRIRVENETRSYKTFTSREEALRQSLIATHTLLGAEQGKFISLLEPPGWAKEAVDSCVNLHTWPVLVGHPQQANLMLSAPIILYDYPQVAPESTGDFFDATEIDELLTLRTMTLTEDEKREAKATDGRAASVLNRIERMPSGIFSRLHGARRDVRGMTKGEEKSVWARGILIARGSKVRLRPGRRRADAQDMFLDGRVATVERVVWDVENKSYVAVTLVDDPAADLHQWYGRFLYFAPEEVEPITETSVQLDGEKPS